MKKIQLDVIKDVYSTIGIEYPIDDFVKALEQGQKDVNNKKKLQEQIEKNTIEVCNIVDKLDGDSTADKYIRKYVKDTNWFDAFYNDEGMDDEGETTKEYFLIEDKLYVAELYCEAEWVSDWSVRMNLPGEVSVTSIKEITNYDVLKRERTYLTVLLK